MVYPPGRVLATENYLTDRNLRLTGYGSDSGGGGTHELLRHFNNRFGHVSSFTGTYRADVWRLNIHRSDSDSELATKANSILH